MSPTACLIAGLICTTACLAQDGQPMTPRTAQLLAAGTEPVRIVCFGDSITGVYYHSGGLRAYPEMLQVALEKLYPGAPVKVFNAGISGNNTNAALARIERDVLARKPHLVTIMFGMNDLVGVPRDKYRENLLEIIRRCREAGAEVIICTPNSIYRDAGARTIEGLAQYAQDARGVGEAAGAPVIDFFGIYENLWIGDRHRWMLLMSETIHPGMDGHKLFAEELAKGISGRDVSLRDVGPIVPELRRVPGLLKQGKPVKVVAMPPFDKTIADTLQTVRPGATLEVTTWPVEGKTLAELETWAKAVREMKPDLVLIGVPLDAAYANEEQFIRSYNWVLDWSLSFGIREWDVVAVLPTVVRPQVPETWAFAAQWAREVAMSKDIGVIERADPTASVEDIIRAWFAPRCAD